MGTSSPRQTHMKLLRQKLAELREVNHPQRPELLDEIDDLVDTIDCAQNRMSSVLGNCNDLVLILHVGGSPLYANQALLDFLPANSLNEIPEDWIRETVLLRRDTVMENGPWQGISSVRRLNGEEIPFSQKVIPHRDADGEVSYLSAILFNLSELYEKDAEAMENSRRLNLAVQGGEVGTWDWDLVQDDVIWNEQEYELVGLDPNTAEIRPTTFFEMIHPDDRGHADQQVKEVLDGRSDEIHLECRVVRQDGQVRWLAARGTAIRDEQGRITKIIGVNYDVTSSKELEQRLRENQHRFELALRIAPLFLCQSDRNLKCTWFAAGTHQVDEEAFLGKTDYELFGQDADDLVALKQEVLQTGSERRESLSFALNGVDHHWDVHIAPVHDGDSISGVTMAAYNVTEQRNMQAQLRESEQRLRSVIMDAPLPIVLHDIHGRFVMMNRVFEQESGYQAEEVATGVDWAMKAYRLSRAEAEALIAGASEEFRTMKRDRSREVTLYTKSGETRIWAMHSSRLSYGEDELIVTMALDLTELRQTQAREMAAAAQNASIDMAIQTIQAMDTGVLLLDANGNVMSLNPALTALTELASDEVAGQDFQSLLPRAPLTEAGRQQLGAALDLLRQAKLPPPFTVEMQQGEYTKALVIRGAFIRNDERAISAILMTFQDITEIRRAETAEREARQFLENIFSDIDVLIAYLDPEFNFIRVNQKYAEAVSMTVDDFLGKNHFDLFPNEENRELFEKARDTARPHRELAKPFKHPRDDGLSKSYWNWSIVPVLNRQGGVEGMILSLQDVTPRVLAEQALSRSEAKYRSVVERIPAVSYVCEGADQDARMIYVNPQVEQLLHIPADTYLGGYPDTWEQIVAGEDRDAVITAVRTALQHDSTFDLEYPIRRADGQLLWFHEVSTLTHDGGVVQRNGIMYDITEKREAQEAQSRYRDRLRDLNSELLLTEERERRELASSLHDSVGAMLALIKIKLGLAERADDPAKKNGLLQESRGIVDETDRQVRSLTFELSPPTLHAHGLEPAVKQLAESFQRSSKIDVTCRTRGKMQISDSVRLLLFRSVSELLHNIRKHAKASKIHIQMMATMDKVKIVVSDDGVGFNLADIENGNVVTGFGLFSIQERMELLNGELQIQSGDGNGTTITLFLPNQ